MHIQRYLPRLHVCVCVYMYMYMYTQVKYGSSSEYTKQCQHIYMKKLMDLVHEESTNPSKQAFSEIYMILLMWVKFYPGKNFRCTVHVYCIVQYA